jgi:hypothetical protein
MPTLIAVAARIAVAVALGGAITVAAPTVAAAAAPADVFVEVNPSTIEAGEKVGVRASCPNNEQEGTATSGAFGRVTLEPRFDFLTASVTIPDTQAAGSYAVRLTCSTGETASVTLHVVRAGQPTKGPATGFGGTAGGGSGGLLIGAGLLAIGGGVALGLLSLRRRRVAG